MSAALTKARAAWGDAIPDWIVELAKACDATSQNKVAVAIGRSSSLVSNVLANKYPADLSTVEYIVRGVFMRAVVVCPGTGGEIGTDVCQTWRKAARKFTGHNALRVQMYRACNRCPLHKPEVQS